MVRSRYSALVCLAISALAFVVALPERARDLFVGFIDWLAPVVDVRPFVDFLRTGEPTLAYAGQTPIDPALAHDQKHEAGLARLGAVRHR